MKAHLAVAAGALAAALAGGAAYTVTHHPGYTAQATLITPPGAPRLTGPHVTQLTPTVYQVQVEAPTRQQAAAAGRAALTRASHGRRVRVLNPLAVTP